MKRKTINTVLTHAILIITFSSGCFSDVLCLCHGHTHRMPTLSRPSSAQETSLEQSQRSLGEGQQAGS